jgi:F-type H+-transporting ATPase subunit gamma
MATLKEISMRLKSVSNIAKITKSMKMIASTKMTRATKTMNSARLYGATSGDVFKHSEALEPKVPIVMGISSDKGLCGGIHSSIIKVLKKYMIANNKALVSTVGLKIKNPVGRVAKDKMVVSFEGVGKAGPTWGEAALVANGILKCGALYDGVQIFYNKFKSVIAYEATSVFCANVESLEAAPKIAAYEVEKDVLKNYAEFAFANTLYWTIAEGYASEMSARRTAMENATKNAGDMITKLTLTYNRQRQAVITNELCDIITGASAL